MERERRLGLIRQAPSTPVQPVGLVPNGMWPRGTPAPSQQSNQGRGRTTPLHAGRPMTAFPSHMQLPPAQQFSQLPPFHHQPRAVLRTPERPRNIAPNPNSPFNDPRRQNSGPLIEGHYVEDRSGTLKPIVVQALNQLCAIELQVRVQTINEEIWGRNELLIELEHIQELEAFRAASQELIALESRSRTSIVGHQADAWSSLVDVASESQQEARLTGLIRETQERHLRSLPSSTHATPVRHRPSSRPLSPINNNTSINQKHRSDLGWASERLLTTKEISPPRPTRTVTYRNVADVDRTTSQEEEVLNAKIARQRGLMDSTRSLYHVHTKDTNYHSSIVPVRAAPSTPDLTKPFHPTRQPPPAPNGETFHQDPSSLSLREASFEATRSRISALSYYQ